MEHDNFGVPLKETIEELKAYLEIQVTYNKLVFTRKVGELSSYILLLVLLLSIGGLVLLFFSFAFAGWFGSITKLGIVAGYLVVAGFYVIMGSIIYIFRNKLIFNPTRKLFGKIFFGTDNSTGESHTFTFDSEESQLQDIKVVHNELLLQRDNLNEKINKLGNNLTFTNITHQLLDKAYKSVMTTSNIAKFTFKLVKKLKWFTEGKKRKASKNREKQLLKDAEE